MIHSKPKHFYINMFYDLCPTLTTDCSARVKGYSQSNETAHNSRVQFSLSLYHVYGKLLNARVREFRVVRLVKRRYRPQ